MKMKGKRQKVKGKKSQPLLLLFGFTFLLVPFALSLSACGKKGDPRAPELAAPEPIRDLKGEAEKQGISLTWTRPTRYVDGKRLVDLAAFVIFRKEISKSCPECPAAYRERASVSVEDQEKFIKKRKFRFVDRELRPETSYRYRVFSQLRDASLSDPSNEVEVLWRP